MAKTRSLSRPDSRPSTPLNASVTAQTPAAVDSTRPRKQRKTGRHSRVGVDSPAAEAGPQPTSQNGLKRTLSSAAPTSAGGSDAKSEDKMSEGSWIEPPLPPPRPSYQDYNPNLRVDKHSILGTMQPLGTLPSERLLKSLGILPTSNASPAMPASPEPRQGVAKKGATSSKAVKANERPKTSPSSNEELSRENGSLTPFESADRRGLQPQGHEEQLTRSTRSKTGQETPATESPAPLSRLSQSVGPSLCLKEKVAREKMRPIVGAAIQKADSRHNIAIARGLHQLWEESGSDPFLVYTMENIVLHRANVSERAIFRAVMRDAMKRYRAENANAAVDMVRTQSAESGSTLSTAKSIDADHPVSAAAPGSTAARGVFGKFRGKLTIKAKGKGRKSLIAADLARKRKMRDDPEFSDEALAAKRARLLKKFPDMEIEESNVRTVVTPPPVNTSTENTTRAHSENGDDSEFLSPMPNLPARKKNRKTVWTTDVDNIDFCRACGGSGELLCCDGCVDSFHFTCLDPPVDPTNPPEGKWFCPSCSSRRLMGPLFDALEELPETPFTLPRNLRDYFQGVRTGKEGEYEEYAPIPKGGRTRVARSGRAEDLVRLYDSKGKIILCAACGLSSGGRRPIIQCDFCPNSWHLDCLNPPLANPPLQKPGSDKPYHYWKCPRHTDHDLAEIEFGGRVGKVRRPAHPRFVDVDVIPAEEEESFNELDMQGVVYRVPEKGLVLNFIERVKRDRAREKALNSQLFRVGPISHTDMISDVISESTPSLLPQVQDEAPHDTAREQAMVTLSSRPAIEQEAVMNLAALAQSNPDLAMAPDRIGILIDQLVANSPEKDGAASKELEELRALQELISRRILALNQESFAANQALSEPMDEN